MKANPDWVKELQIMVSTKVKAEIQVRFAAALALMFLHTESRSLPPSCLQVYLGCLVIFESCNAVAVAGAVVLRLPVPQPGESSSLLAQYLCSVDRRDHGHLLSDMVPKIEADIHRCTCR